jgi:hypothetical protein
VEIGRSSLRSADSFSLCLLAALVQKIIDYIRQTIEIFHSVQETRIIPTVADML